MWRTPAVFCILTLCVTSSAALGLSGGRLESMIRADPSGELKRAVDFSVSFVEANAEELASLNAAPKFDLKTEKDFYTRIQKFKGSFTIKSQGWKTAIEASCPPPTARVFQKKSQALSAMQYHVQTKSCLRAIKGAKDDSELTGPIEEFGKAAAKFVYDHQKQIAMLTKLTDLVAQGLAIYTCKTKSALCGPTTLLKYASSFSQHYGDYMGLFDNNNPASLLCALVHVQIEFLIEFGIGKVNPQAGAIVDCVVSAIKTTVLALATKPQLTKGPAGSFASCCWAAGQVPNIASVLLGKCSKGLVPSSAASAAELGGLTMDILMWAIQAANKVGITQFMPGANLIPGCKTWRKSKGNNDANIFRECKKQGLVS